jgi:hypothetical protein
MRTCSPYERVWSPANKLVAMIFMSHVAANTGDNLAEGQCPMRVATVTRHVRLQANSQWHT